MLNYVHKAVPAAKEFIPAETTLCTYSSTVTVTTWMMLVTLWILRGLPYNQGQGNPDPESGMEPPPTTSAWISVVSHHGLSYMACLKAMPHIHLFQLLGLKAPHTQGLCTDDKISRTTGMLPTPLFRFQSASRRGRYHNRTVLMQKKSSPRHHIGKFEEWKMCIQVHILQKAGGGEKGHYVVGNSWRLGSAGVGRHLACAWPFFLFKG